jgi:hypothetical protein
MLTCSPAALSLVRVTLRPLRKIASLPHLEAADEFSQGSPLRRQERQRLLATYTEDEGCWVWPDTLRPSWSRRMGAG